MTSLWACLDGKCLEFVDENLVKVVINFDCSEKETYMLVLQSLDCVEDSSSPSGTTITSLGCPVMRVGVHGNRHSWWQP